MDKSLPVAGRLAVLVLALAVLPAELHAQYFGRNKVQYENFDFRVFDTPHYDFYFYPEEEPAVRDASRMAERWYDRHARTFNHNYGKKPLIFYANDADFHQTNVIEGQLGQGTGGVTEAMMNRVVMPLTGIYAETDHVLGHELVHTFQYDIVQSPGGGGLRGISQAPLWLVEGMSEYLTIGRNDAHTAMWLRDALLRDDLPTIDQITRDMRYFPYRYGQAYAAYIGGRYGDEAVANLFRQTTIMGLDSAIVAVTGIESDSLSSVWKQAVRDTYTPLMAGRVHPDSLPNRVLARDIDAGDMNIAPSVSPDGRYVVFLSERDLFSIDLFLADAQTGRVIRKLSESDSDPHMDALRFINSAGTWSPDGEKFAFIVFHQGDNEISILDVDSRDVERRIKVSGVGAMANPAWSPDGRFIAVSGIMGGISDLYLIDVETGTARQLTDDRYADLQPAWSPDGRTLAFVTDRGPGGSNFELLEYAELRLALIDVTGGAIRPLVPFEGAKHINPQFSPDGRDLYFISNPDGFSDIYRTTLATGEISQVTRVKTGISGITSEAPAMSVASRSGRVMFSVFYDNEYTVHALSAEEARGTPVSAAAGMTAAAGLLPPTDAATRGLVSRYLETPRAGLPSVIEDAASPYSPKLRLAYVGPPSFGVGYDAQFGAGVAGGVSFFWSDILGNRNIALAVQANGTVKDIGGQLAYINRGQRLNWGAVASHIPYLTGYTSVGFDPSSGMRVYDQYLQRILFTDLSGIAQYPFSTTRRVEANLGYAHIGFDVDVERYFVDAFGRVVGRDRENVETRSGIHMATGSAAWVGDWSFFGFTSPVRGGRFRYEAGFNAGTYTYGSVLGDYRRYFYMSPVTFAVNAYHFGRYGADADEGTLYPLFLGYGMYSARGVRGYGRRTFDAERECSNTGQGDCPEFDRLIGSRVAVASAELRLPFFGTSEFGLINFPYLPTEFALFADGGMAWWGGEGSTSPEVRFDTDTTDRVPVFSTGVTARINVLGYAVFEVFYVYPFQRPEQGWHIGFTLAPGW